MNRIFGEKLKQWDRESQGPCPMRRTLMRILFLGLLFLADQAVAGYAYRMVGGGCQDSNRAEVFYPDAANSLGAWGPGPTLCADQVFAEITLRDEYVPGTRFEYFDEPGAKLKVEAFTFTDGARSASTAFPLGMGRGGYVQGVLPEHEEASALRVLWHEGWFFEAGKDGTWMFGEEFGGRDGVCGLGSIEGPNLTGTACTPTQTHYYSKGSYQGWFRVPEPPPLRILALALAVMAGLRYRRR